MMLIRPISANDLDALYEMARQAGIGVTTLPVNKDMLAQRINESQNAFGELIGAGDASYLFALEDTGRQKICGVSAIKARVGLDEVWYSYRLSTTVNACGELGLHVQTPTLHLTNDMTNCTELCTLFLEESYRHGHNGRLLSKCRFMFLADFAERFSSRVFAEMRGYADEQGNSPFWESLGAKFFGLEFKKADYLTGIGKKAFIAELMPKYPIFVPFFAQSTQDVIGQVHPATQPALKMLEGEGFHTNGMVDIFDAGPLVEAFVTDIRAVRASVIRHVIRSPDAAGLEQEPGTNPVMVSNRSFSDFRAGLIHPEQVGSEHISISGEMFNQLRLKPGNQVRVVALRTS